jgi:hypothetical protein
MLIQSGGVIMTKICFHHATFYTMRDSQHTIEAVLVENGKIIETGFFEDLAKRDTYRFAGLMSIRVVDSLIHMIGLEIVRYIDLSKYMSPSEMMTDLKTF